MTVATKEFDSSREIAFDPASEAALERELEAELRHLAITMTESNPVVQVVPQDLQITMLPGADEIIRARKKADTSELKFEPLKSDVLEPAEVSVDDQEGWRIARQTMVREFSMLAGRVFLALALLGMILTAAFVGYQKLVAIKPEQVKQAAATVFPVLKESEKKIEAETVRPLPQTVKAVVVSKPRAARPRPGRKTVKREVAQARRYPAGYWGAGDHPRGGRIIYSDGVTTQYQWPAY